MKRDRPRPKRRAARSRMRAPSPSGAASDGLCTLRPNSFGLRPVCGASSGLLLLVLPALARGEKNSMLLLLRNYLFGFDVTLTGAAIGILRSASLGFVLGF